jgi:S-formylglutathione hydrolase
MKLEQIANNKSFGGGHRRFRHPSSVNNCNMTFAIFLPPLAGDLHVPVLYWLSGLTCTDENFMQKAGAQRVAAELGVAIVAPDTSPRGADVPDDKDGAYDLGLGAGFYVNATREPWVKNYRMYDYVVHELPDIIEASFPVNQVRSISGHSMGGHGALVIGLRNPERYRSISAFSPIVNPMRSPWGIKAFTHYLGEDREMWKPYDSCALLSGKQGKPGLPVLIDQGDRDDFLKDQLKTGNLEQVIKHGEHPVEIRYQSGYDHSYYFIASFIEDHLRFHLRYFS